jgi:hypothetical protein
LKGTRAGDDAAKTLKNLLPRGAAADQAALSKVCRTLHLAFKSLTTDEVYDVMALCFLRACHRYDPCYQDKVKQVCEVLNGKTQQFTPDDITALVGFDVTRHLRLLVGKGYLVAVLNKQRKVSGYRLSKTWPPQPSFFESGPIGFVYFGPRWFRFYVIEYMEKVMAQIETKQGMLQLGDSGHGHLRSHNSRPFSNQGDFNYASDAIPHTDGNYIDQNGRSWAADMSLMKHQVDLSEMTDHWVKGTRDRLFRNMTVAERSILQMVFLKEFNWVQIAAMLDCSTATIRQMYGEVMVYLRGHMGLELMAV